MQVDKTLDASGLNCPLPILKTKKALAELSSGQILQVITTDPGSMRDITEFCRQTGHALLSSVDLSDRFEFHIKRR